MRSLLNTHGGLRADGGADRVGWVMRTRSPRGGMPRKERCRRVGIEVWELWVMWEN